MQRNRLQRWAQFWNRGVTLIILVNLILVLFNMTYISLRGIYLDYLPFVVQHYDAMKGIEPHPVTQNYLDTVDQLRSQVAQTGVSSPETAEILADLRAQSENLITENPFLAADQTATFAKLNRRMRGYTQTLSAKSAFETFWQPDYLLDRGWGKINAFLREQIEPLLERNYFRETLPTGQFVDNLWYIDGFFMAFFAGELLLRTFIISRYRQELTWGDAIARRWYEVALVIPVWRWLRIIPAAVRLHRTGLINVERLLGQITHEPAAYLSERASKYLLVRLVNQTQDSVQKGTLFSDSGENKIVVGDRNKLDRIIDQVIQITVLNVMPVIKPDVEQLLRYSMQGALTRTDLYSNLQQIPGFSAMPASALDSLSNYFAQATCDVLAESYTDEQGRELFEQLSRNFRYALAQELQVAPTASTMQTLLTDLLEELKVNYIQQSDLHDPELMLDQVERLHDYSLQDNEPSSDGTDVQEWVKQSPPETLNGQEESQPADIQSS